MSRPDDLHVLVIGAGITGLLIAHGLQKAGIKYSVFESEESALTYRPLEWSMAMHWAIPMLESLLPEHLWDRINEMHNDPFNPPLEKDVFKIYNGLTGEVMKELPVPRTLRTSRRRLRAFFAEGISVLYDYKLSNITSGHDNTGVTATFTNGRQVSGSIIIGADGPRSKVRELLLGEDRAKVTPLNVVYYNATVCYNDAEKAKMVRSTHPVWSVCIHPDLLGFISIQNVPGPAKPETWRFQIVNTWPGEIDQSLDNADRLALLKNKTSVLPEPFRSAVQWIPDDTHVTVTHLGYWLPVLWNREGMEGRGSLAGDAAHPMPPHRGQGLNHAICDANAFVETIKKVKQGQVGLKDAVESYNDGVVERGAEEVKSSLKNVEMMHDWTKVMESPLMKHSLDR